jgi:hypothetical protein
MPMLEDSTGNYLFDRPGHYQIRVVGMLDECWLEHLEGLEISFSPWGNYQQVTKINGWLADQTVLSGLLDLLTDLGKVILTVERIEMDEMIE